MPTIDLFELIVCSECLGRFDRGRDLQCCECGRAYPIVNGIPVLLPSGRDEFGTTRQREAAFFDCNEGFHHLEDPTAGLAEMARVARRAVCITVPADAALEAAEILKARRGATEGQRPGRFLGSWPERRRALKTRVWYRLPGRPMIRFLWMYVLRRGFLDGRQGLIYSQLIAFHEAFANAKLFEQEAAAEAMRRRGD